MRAVAPGPRLGCLATAEINRFGFVGRERHRIEAAALVAAVAERLLLAQAAGAPEILLSLFDRHAVGGLLGADGKFRFGHRVSSRARGIPEGSLGL